MRDDDREKMLRRRLHHARLYLRFLQHLATDPETANSELDRRHSVIESLLEQVALQRKAIERLQYQRDNVYVELERTERTCNHFSKELDKILIEEYIAEYHAINKKIEALDVNPFTGTG